MMIICANKRLCNYFELSGHSIIDRVVMSGHNSFACFFQILEIGQSLLVSTRGYCIISANKNYLDTL